MSALLPDVPASLGYPPWPEYDIVDLRPDRSALYAGTTDSRGSMTVFVPFDPQLAQGWSAMHAEVNRLVKNAVADIQHRAEGHL